MREYQNKKLVHIMGFSIAITIVIAIAGQFFVNDEVPLV
jgi:hypothetical protein